VSILKVARIGHPVLRRAAEAVTPEALQTDELLRLIDDMVETMHEYEGVGVAAPQLHLGLRLAVIEIPDTDERSDDGVPLTVLVNPEVEPLGDEIDLGWEGCLSIPDLRGLVPRFVRVRLKALDRRGQPYETEASDFFARVIQHECDHLDGNVYLDRMLEMRSLGFTSELERFPGDG